MTKLPVICFIGPSKSGKTTVIEFLIKQLPNLNIVTAKFTHHERFTINPIGKDNQRHIDAGAVANFSFAPKETSIIIKQKTREEFDVIYEYIESLENSLDRVDAVFCEGYKNPPSDVIGILTGSSKKDLENYLQFINQSQILCCTGKVSNELNEFQSIPVYNVWDDEDSRKLVQKIMNIIGIKPTNTYD